MPGGNGNGDRLNRRGSFLLFGALFLSMLAALPTSSTAIYVCPTVEDTFIDTITVNAFPELIQPYADKVPGADKANDAEKLSQTKKAMWVVKMYRKGKGEAYYKDVIKYGLIEYCQRYGLHDQFVEDTDAKAAKDSNDNCIVTAGPGTPLAGQCEIQENCYWEAPVSGEVRERKYTDEEAAAATAFLKKYAIGLGIVIAPGVVLGVLNLIIMFFVVICRFCCKCCGGRPKEEGYTCCQRWSPLVIFCIFSIGVLVCAILAFVGNMDVTRGTLETFQSLDHGIIRFQRFLGRAEAPLTGISDTTIAAVNETIKTLDNTDWLSPGVDSVVDRLVAFRDLYGSKPGMTSVATSINDTLAQITSQVDPIITNAQTTISALTDQLLPVKDTVVIVVGVAVDMISSVNASIGGVGDNLDVYNDKTQSFSAFQLGGVMALFILSILLIVLGCCGIGAGLTPCKFDDCLMVLMHITWVCGSFIVTLSFIISSVALFLGVFWFDACNMIEVVTQDFDTYVPNAMAAKTLNACFNGTSLLTTFNLTDSLSFADTLSSSLAGMATLNVTSAFNFVQSPIAAVDTQLRTFNGSSQVSALNQLSHPTSGACLGVYTTDFTWSTIAYPWNADVNGAGATTSWDSDSYARQGVETAATYMSRVYDASACSASNAGLFTAWQALYNATVYVPEMRRDLGYNTTVCSQATCPEPNFPYDTSIYSQLNVYKSNITGVNDKLTNLTSSFVGDLVDYVDEFKCNAYCTFVKSTYNDLNVAMCGTLLGGFLQIGISLFLLSLFMFALVILTMTLKTRLTHPLQRVFVNGEEEMRSPGKGGDGGAEEGQYMEQSGPRALVV